MHAPKTHTILLSPGDGIGLEVIPIGLAAMRRAGEVTGSFAIATVDYPWSCRWYAPWRRRWPRTSLQRWEMSRASRSSASFL